jgi:hypothetical protein
MFLINIYNNDEYRINILDKNDDFFIMNSHEDITNNDKIKIDTMFQFKKYWVVMPASLREYIKSALVCLVNVSKQYVELKGQIYDISQISKE